MNELPYYYTKMKPDSKPLALMALLFCASLLPSIAFADSPIGAKAVFVTGEPMVISVKDSKAHPIVVGTKFTEGDRVKTGSTGVVEIEFDTSDLIRVDNNSDMKIKALHRNDEGSTQSIFHLFVGRVKSAVSKLVDKKSKFEYQTKAAIAGVAGTPPFFFTVINNVAEVDLTGEEGEAGEVYVRGMDSGHTLVRLLPGFRTTVNFGIAPLNPFRISASRMNHFGKTMPFRMLKRKRRTGGNVGGQGIGIVVNTIHQKVSTPRQNRPSQTQEPAGIVNDNPQEQGIIGNDADSSGSQAPPKATSVKIIINLK